MAKQTQTERLVSAAMREVHENPPSTLDPKKTGAEREAQQRAIALSKARAKGARIPKLPPMSKRARGSRPFSNAEIMRGYRVL